VTGNEELILLRAEANIGLGNLAAAQTDIKEKSVGFFNPLEI